MSFLSSLAGVLEKVAPAVANLVVPGAGTAIEGLVNSMVPGDDDAETKAQQVLKDPKLLAQVQQKAMDLEASIAQQQTKNMSDVNATMRAELTSGKWYQRAWRPWNGFWFPLAIIGNYVALPMLLAGGVTVPTIPWQIFVAWAGVLGVAAYGRNQEKKALHGAQPGVVANTIAAAVKKAL